MTGEDPLARLGMVGYVTPEIEEALIGKYGHRGEKALRLVREGRVLEIGGVTYVRGDHGTYRTQDGKCSCPAGYRFVKEGVVSRHPESHGKPYIPRLRSRECSHSIALRIAKATGEVTRAPEATGTKNSPLRG